MSQIARHIVDIPGTPRRHTCNSLVVPDITIGYLQKRILSKIVPKLQLDPARRIQAQREEIGVVLQ